MFVNIYNIFIKLSADFARRLSRTKVEFKLNKFLKFFSDGKCLKGWTFFNGSCFFPYDVKTSWHQALDVCQITGADLPTDIVASKLIPRGGSSWFGVRSCPNGRWYSTQAVQYYFRSSSMSHATCVQLHFPATQDPVYRSSSCDAKVPFVCQKGIIMYQFVY